MRHDHQQKVQFSSAQSPLGTRVYAALNMPIDDSYLLIDKDGVHTKSDGYFRLATVLGGWWRLAVVARLIPRPLRDWLYDRIAANRYRWFGRVEQCALLTAEQRQRLIAEDAGLSETLAAR